MSPPAHRKLEWEERPLGELLRLSWPIALSMVSFSVMNLADTLFVGRLGADALAGVGLGGVVCWVIICFSLGLTRAVKVLVSQAVGAGHLYRPRLVLGAGLKWAALLGVASLLVAELVVPLVAGASASPSAAAAAKTYIQIRMLGAPVILAFAMLREYRYGLGDSRTPMRASVAGNLANIALDYVFIFVLDWGVAGAAFATVLGQSLEAGVLALLQWAEGFGLRQSTRRDFLAVWRVGLPTGIQFILEMGSFTIMAMMIAAYSEVHMAAHQIALHTVLLSFLPALAVGESASVLAGQAVGARRDELVVPVAKLAFKVTGAYMALCMVILAVGARFFASQFTDDPEVVDLATKLLYVAAVFQLADSANVSSRSVLRGTGDVRIPALIGIVTAWLVTPPLTWLLGYHLDLGALGGWLGLCLELFAAAGIFWYRLLKSHWLPAAERTRAEIEADADTDVVAPRAATAA